MHIGTPTGILLFVLWLLLTACGGEKTETTGQELAETSAYKTFIYQGEGVDQRLQVRWLNDTTISFVLEHHLSDCHYTLSGEAVNPYQTYDPESDVDEDTGEVYWIDLYLYNQQHCRMAIRMAQDTTRAQLQLANCAASASCGIESAGVLRRE